jgi:Txe/YoeB family toxin of toxin-antitoxin system
MRNISFTPGAYADYLSWLSTDKKVFLKITNLIKETTRNPESGTGKPERLKHELTGLLWAALGVNKRVEFRDRQGDERPCCRIRWGRWSNRGTVEPSNRGTVEPSNRGTVESWNRGTV